MSVIPVPDPPLSDGVVTLRRFEPHDAATIADACSDPLIPRFTFMADDLTPEKAMDWIERRAEQWRTGQVAGFAIVGTVDPRRLIGTIGLGINQNFVTGEVFYWVAAGERRRGVATRSVQLISAWAFERLALERLELLTHPENVASRAVAAACGYTYEGTLRSHRPFKEGRMDSALFSLLPGEQGRVTQDR